MTTLDEPAPATIPGEAGHVHTDRPGYADTKDALAKRLRRIEGQVRGIERMIEEDRYCIDVLTQISAIQSGLKAVALALLDDHLAHCVVRAARQGGEEEATKLAEVSDAIARLVR
ncbi:MAG: metal-sensitive transcriptional regulator [Dermatophilaceae bacterium]